MTESSTCAPGGLDGAPGHDGAPVSLAERGLFAAALDFHGAAAGAIELDGAGRPRVRWDRERLEPVRDAMRALERRVGVALRSGVPVDRVACVARIERELVERIAARHGRPVRAAG